MRRDEFVFSNGPLCTSDLCVPTKASNNEYRCILSTRASAPHLLNIVECQPFIIHSFRKFLLKFAYQSLIQASILMASSKNPKEKLGIVVNSLDTANKALREVIGIKSDEIGRLEQFKKRFEGTKNKFEHFRSLTEKHEEQDTKLESLLNEELSRHKKTAEALRSEIDNLKRAIEQQSLTSEKLTADLKYNAEKLQTYITLNDGNNHGSISCDSTIPKSNTNSFIQRLQDELLLDNNN